MKVNKLLYVAGALPRRLFQKKRCPSCNAFSSERVDRKGFHELRRCASCALLYRWPCESSAEMERYYQRQYSQSGLTTELPDSRGLEELLSTGFKGSEKDFSRVIELFRALQVPKGSRIIDYGANWGYGVWQFREAGYDAVGFELSRSRAHFGKKLGIDILTDWRSVTGDGLVDVIFSSHVLEHTSDPAAALREQLAALRPNGWLVALFPNGSEPFRRAHPDAFHHLWGQVHPVMLNDVFARAILGDQVVYTGTLEPGYLANTCTLSELNNEVGDLSGSEMLLLARKRPGSADLRQEIQ